MAPDALIGLLGGTFDPVHYGHLRLAKFVFDTLSLQALRLVPCGQPPHRPAPVASPQQRLTMLQLALQEFPELTLEQRELNKTIPAYTVATLRSLHAEQQNQQFAWILGLDAFNQFMTWYQYQEILELAHLIVIQRPKYKLQPAIAELLTERQVDSVIELTQKAAGAILVLDTPLYPISATQIRQQIQYNEAAWEAMLPAAVADYIKTEALYY